MILMCLNLEEKSCLIVCSKGEREGTQQEISTEGFDWFVCGVFELMYSMCVIQDMTKDLNEARVFVKDPGMNIDWKYEFSAPKYYDFSCEETQRDVLAAERWFEIAIPYENSRTCFHSTTTNLVDILFFIDNFFNLTF